MTVKSSRVDRQQTTLLPECLDDWVGEILKPQLRLE
jgi:hypothetical protein